MSYKLGVSKGKVSEGKVLRSGVGWVERSEAQHITELSALSRQRSAARCGCLVLRLLLLEVLGSRL